MTSDRKKNIRHSRRRYCTPSTARRWWRRAAMAAELGGNALFGIVEIDPREECRCTDSEEFGVCTKREGRCDTKDEGAGEVHDEDDKIL